jgi:hypothetical protein
VGNLLAAGGCGDEKAATGDFYFARLAIPSVILHIAPAPGKKNHRFASPPLSH